MEVLSGEKGDQNNGAGGEPRKSSAREQISVALICRADKTLCLDMASKGLSI